HGRPARPHARQALATARAGILPVTGNRNPRYPSPCVHGLIVYDDTVPLAMSQLVRTGRLVAIPGAGHFDLIDPLSHAWPQVLAVLTGIYLPSLKRAVPPAFWRRRRTQHPRKAGAEPRP
ncbi:MAG: hypothetical protein ACRDOU_29200, partial [Streptosporangiaceae bacterium]